MSVFARSALGLVLLSGTMLFAEGESSADPKYQAVLALKLVGYWPADEGGGETLNDRSGNNNHGHINHVPWDHGLLDFTGAYQWVEIPASKKYQSKSLTIGGWVFIRSKVEGSGWPNRQGLLLIGNRDWLNAVGVQLCVRRQELVDNDANWWHQMAGKSGSLDGSVRDMVWFDRALSADEAARLHEVTRPSAQPKFYGEGMVVLNGRGIAPGDLRGLTAPQRRAALQLFAKKDAATLPPLSEALLPVLTTALQEADCRLPATQLLAKLNSDPARAVLRANLPQLIAVVQAADKAQGERAEAALALAAMKQGAAGATVALAQTLDELLKQEGERLPRVEDLLRNALIRALLDDYEKIIGKLTGEYPQAKEWRLSDYPHLHLHDPVRGSVPKAPTADRPLAWAWEPPFYNFCRDDWGAKFDKTGRLHVKMQIEGLDGGGYVRLSSVYAYSDDNARTFHRADGSPVVLPLTINPAPEHNADMLKNDTDQWWNVWLAIVRYAGLT